MLGGKFKVDRWTVPCTTTDTVSFQFNMPRPVATMPKWEIPANALVGPPVAEDSNMCATTLWGVDIPYPTGPVGILGSESSTSPPHSLHAERSPCAAHLRSPLPPWTVHGL